MIHAGPSQQRDCFSWMLEVIMWHGSSTKPFEKDTADTFKRSGENECREREDAVTSQRIGAVRGRRSHR